MKFLFIVILIAFACFPPALLAQTKIGIGTAAPQQMLSVAEGINVDQNNGNRTTLLNGLKFGSNSNVGIASNRGNDFQNNAINNLIFFTNDEPRLVINRDGKITIGGANEYGRVNIRKESRYDFSDYQFASALNIYGESQTNNEHMLIGSDNTNKLSFINAERVAPYVNTGSTLLLQAKGRLVVGPILSPTEKMEVAGNVRITGLLMVDSNKGIIRNSNSTQLIRQVATVTVSGSFAAGETRQFDIIWPTPFSGNPEAYIGNVISGGGGWAECIMSLALVSSTSGKLYVFNPRNISFSPSFTVNILGFGSMPL